MHKLRRLRASSSSTRFNSAHQVLYHVHKSQPKKYNIQSSHPLQTLQIELDVEWMISYNNAESPLSCSTLRMWTLLGRGTTRSMKYNIPHTKKLGWILGTYPWWSQYQTKLFWRRLYSITLSEQYRSRSGFAHPISWLQCTLRLNMHTSTLWRMVWHPLNSVVPKALRSWTYSRVLRTPKRVSFHSCNHAKYADKDTHASDISSMQPCNRRLHSNDSLHLRAIHDISETTWCKNNKRTAPLSSHSSTLYVLSFNDPWCWQLKERTSRVKTPGVSIHTLEVPRSYPTYHSKHASAHATPMAAMSRRSCGSSFIIM